MRSIWQQQWARAGICRGENVGKWKSGKVEKWGLVKPCKWNSKSMGKRGGRENSRFVSIN